MKKLVLFVAALSVIFSHQLMVSPRASAAFNPNNIMDNFTFDNFTAAGAADIDNWLNRLPNSCISPNKGFGAVIPTGYTPGGGFTYGGVGTAGQVISAAAQTYGISPQVLLATLQKEQSLVTGFSNGCSIRAYSAAVGYGCPDSGGAYSYSGVSLYYMQGVVVSSIPSTCVNAAAKAGFSQQVIRAAWMLKFSQQRSEGNTAWAVIKGSWNNSDDPQSCYSGAMTQGYRKRCASDHTAVYYDGYTTIDGQTVHLGNGTTAALYRYTPHFHGNQNFVNIFNSWFGSQYSNDSLTAHPNGTLVSLNGRVYLIENNQRRYVLNAAVFNSHGYTWERVEKGTTGDSNLPAGSDVNTLAAGTIFTAPNQPVYAMTYENGNLVKQHVSYSAYNALGYKWNDILYMDVGEIPPGTNTGGILFESKHPAGSLVVDPGTGRTYLLEQNSKRFVMGPPAFITNGFRWEQVKTATPADLALSDGEPLNLRQGSIILADGIYVVDYDQNGIFKRPVGPWECFALRMQYSFSDGFPMSPAGLPARTGANFTC